MIELAAPGPRDVHVDAVEDASSALVEVATVVEELAEGAATVADAVPTDERTRACEAQAEDGVDGLGERTRPPASLVAGLFVLLRTGIGFESVWARAEPASLRVYVGRKQEHKEPDCYREPTRGHQRGGFGWHDLRFA